MNGSRILKNVTSKQFVSSRLTTRRNYSKTQNVLHGSSPIVELKEYELFPSQMEQYTQLTTQLPDIVQSPVSTACIRLIAQPETGWKINTAAHLHYFKGGFEERNDRYDAMAVCPKWNQYNQLVNTCMMSVQSNIFVEAPFVSSTNYVCGLEPGNVEQKLEGIAAGTGLGVYEIRRYQLKLGYDTVPNFLQLYEEGLPSKLNADGTDPSTTLVTLLYSEVGPLNSVIEIWRHDDTSAMERSRVAARSAEKWRDSIAQIATLANVFTSSIYKPLSSSPLR